MSAPNGFPGSQGWPAKSQTAQNSDQNEQRQDGAQAPAWSQQRVPTQPYLGAPAAHHDGANHGAAPHQQWHAAPPAGGPGGYVQPQSYSQANVQSLSQVIGQSQSRAPTQPYTPPLYVAPPSAPLTQQNPGYAPQFEQAFQNHAATRATTPAQPPPYAQGRQSAPQAYPPQHGYAPPPPQAAQAYPHPSSGQWPSAAPTRDYDIGSYMPPQTRAYPANATLEREPTLNDWGQAAGYADDAHRQQGADDLGFAQAAGGELDPAYADEDQDYDYEEAPRRRRPVIVMAALAGAVLVGGGLAYGYKMVVGDGGGGQPPVIKSALEPSKTKPADAGGKQFAHADSKLMGRLGGGSGGSAAVAASSSDASANDLDSSGTRKVATLVVGRDGTIQAPAVVAPPAPTATGVPGLTVVDALAPQPTVVDPPAAAAPPEAPAASSAAVPEVVNAAPQKVVVTPPPAAPQPPPQSTGSVGDAAEVEPPSPPPAKPKKIAAAAPVAAETAAAPKATGANGYVAVLASVPTSGTSRMDALKRYADMQQKYASLLTGKTPDVTEANLGAKGNYHRLVVGPPSSRDKASTLCTQLKSQGYNDCWVTAY